MAWEIDPVHSHVGFAVKHMMITTVKGQFDIIRGKLNIDEANPANSWVEAEAEAASVNTREPNRDNHLRSADFFDAEKHPLITFKSTSIEPKGSNEYKVSGDLTIRGITRPVVFNAEYSGQIKDPYGNARAGISASTKVNRKDFGLQWNALLETGGAVVGDEVNVTLDLEATSKPSA